MGFWFWQAGQVSRKKYICRGIPDGGGMTLGAPGSHSGVCAAGGGLNGAVPAGLVSEALSSPQPAANSNKDASRMAEITARGDADLSLLEMIRLAFADFADPIPVISSSQESKEVFIRRLNLRLLINQGKCAAPAGARH